MFPIDSIGRVARISLDRPAAYNSIAIDQWRALAEALATVAASDARALILRSATPGMFCAGADLSELDQLAADPALRTRFRIEMAAAIEGLAALPIATIAAIDGGCYGAGVAVAIACDMRVAGAAAKFATTPAKVGILYPATDVARLKALLGTARASQMLLSAQTVDVARAQAIGLVEDCAADVDKAALALAGSIAANSPRSVTGLKRILAGDADANRLFEDAFGGADFQEGITAFRARRAADFAS